MRLSTHQLMKAKHADVVRLARAMGVELEDRTLQCVCESCRRAMVSRVVRGLMALPVLDHGALVARA